MILSQDDFISIFKLNVEWIIVSNIKNPKSKYKPSTQTVNCVSYYTQLVWLQTIICYSTEAILIKRRERVDLLTISIPGHIDIMGRGCSSYWKKPDGKSARQRRKHVLIMNTRRPTIITTYTHMLVVKMHLWLTNKSKH